MNGPFTNALSPGDMSFDVQGQTGCTNRNAVSAQPTCDSVCGAGEVAYPTSPSAVSHVLIVMLDCAGKYSPVSTRSAKSFSICSIS